MRMLALRQAQGERISSCATCWWPFFFLWTLTMPVGVDIGGTFTDFVLIREGQLTIHKLPSTPRDHSLAFLAGLEQLGAAALAGPIVHGTTVATNALLERKGARTALVTTKGFRDVLAI